MSASRLELLEGRWLVAMNDVVKAHAGARPSTIPSRRRSAITDSLEELAGLPVGTVFEIEDASLAETVEGIWDDIHDRLMAWAGEVEVSRHEFIRAHVEPIPQGDETLEA